MIRLFPKTKDVRNLEQIARVPPGTMARLASMRLVIRQPGIPAVEKRRRERAFKKLVEEDDHMNRLDALLNNGFGLFFPRFCGLPLQGETNCPNKIRDIFRRQLIGVEPHLCEGVCWK